MEDRPVQTRDQRKLSERLVELLTSMGTRKQFAKGNFLYQEGEQANYLFLIEAGLVQLSKLTMDGKELTLRLCQSGDLLGELTLFTEETNYMLSALVVEDCDAFIINQADIEKELRKDPDLTIEFMKWLTTQMRINQSRIRDLVMNGKKGALYSTLIRISNSYGYRTEEGIALGVHLTNQELARFCMTTRESVNRMLSDLRKKEVVDIEESGKIVIKNIEYLRLEIGCDGCPIDICTID